MHNVGIFFHIIDEPIQGFIDWLNKILKRLSKNLGYGKQFIYGDLSPRDSVFNPPDCGLTRRTSSLSHPPGKFSRTP